MRALPPRPAPLTAEARKRLDFLFAETDRDEAERLLVHECGQNLTFCQDHHPEDLDCFRFAALKLSSGDLEKLRHAIELAKADWRDLLMSAGFGGTSGHLSWDPSKGKT